jgi:glutamate/tyrosine decarboxylase-like PLP-dependent enzyme
VLGAFDPLEKIADLCEKYKLWMHVDAAWGGGALISQKYRKLLKGIERYVNILFLFLQSSSSQKMQ